MGSAAAILLAAGACAPAIPRPGAIDDAAHRAYRELVESVGVDVTAVRGRRIVLDPGHGGGYRGATGQRGTAEADVNLAVGLFLWGLLRDAGAEVHLTRTADRDFLGGELRPPAILPLPAEVRGSGRITPPPLAHADSLRADLAARTAVANEVAPDLFLSIHHNAAASGDTNRNQTQTYYRLGDAGPSLDAAQAIHRHLMRNLATASGVVQPGNYHVLRNSNAVAAVLGEPSFITNPIFEEKLIRIDRVELEATAYFLGIADYFGRGMARVVRLSPTDTVLDAETVELRAEFEGSPLDPATGEFLLDGAAVTALPQGMSFVATPPGPLANGPHEVEVRARCLGGNAAAPARARLEIRRPPAEIRAEAWPPWNGGELPGPLGLRVRVLDRLGAPVADSTEVVLEAPRAASTLTRGGEAWFQLEAGERPAAGASWVSRAGEAEARLPVVTRGAPPTRSGRLIDASGKPVGGAEVMSGDVVARTNPEGGFAVPAPPADGALAVRAPGYLPATIPGPPPAPVLGGVLAGRVIVVDAAGGGSEPLATGPTGVRAADTALDLARRLAAELRRAGAHPVLSRADDRTLPDLARIEAAEAGGAEAHHRRGAAPEPRIRHYPGSARGSRIAAAAAAELAAEAGLALPVRAEVTPILLHTSAPAVEVLLPAPADQTSEDLHLDPDWSRRLARGLLLALAADAGAAPDSLGSAWIDSDASRILLDDASIIPLTSHPHLLRGLEPSPARHRVTALDAARSYGAPEFEVAPGDTARVRP